MLDGVIELAYCGQADAHGSSVSMEKRNSIMQLNPKTEMCFGRRTWVTVFANKRKPMEEVFLWKNETSIMHLHPRIAVFIGRRNWVTVFADKRKPMAIMHLNPRIEMFVGRRN